MKKTYDLSILNWELSGFIPHLWEFERSSGMEWKDLTVEIQALKARVPGSVQGALREARIIPDFDVGDNEKLIEWVENRHWMYKTVIPGEWLRGEQTDGGGLDGEPEWVLKCAGLDYSGWVFVNKKLAGVFKGTHITHSFNIGNFLQAKDNELRIIFNLPPRWLGQFGYTSKITEWKTRFNYTWDWAPRMVQIGIWDGIVLEGSDGKGAIDSLRVTSDFEITRDGADGGFGTLRIKAGITGNRARTILCVLEKDGYEVAKKRIPAELASGGFIWENLDVRPWWPNGMGDQPLYKLTCLLEDESLGVLDKESRRVGFRNIVWRECEGAPEGADPWICVVNGKPVFLRGFNFQPIRVNYADLKPEDYRKRMDIYKEIGANCFRINACGYLEFECFYDMCDEMGIFVWQEFPLTSSGVDNWPPIEPSAIEGMAEIASSFIKRRQHHPSLLMWCGGNEQMGDAEGNKTGMGKPCTLEHPMLARLAGIVRDEDPGRRYIPTSPLGPTVSADPKNFGQGVHWNVHGPNIIFGSDEEMRDYFKNDDALFRAEIYISGAAAASTIMAYKGKRDAMPASKDNPMWKYPTPWWNDWDELVKIHGRAPETLEEYVDWSQEKQAERFYFAMKACRDRFPKIGGALMWGSHDTTPMPVNTTIIDFEGVPKKSAQALKKAWLD